jgi:hypothetical protein
LQLPEVTEVLKTLVVGSAVKPAVPRSLVSPDGIYAGTSGNCESAANQLSEGESLSDGMLSFFNSLKI